MKRMMRVAAGLAVVLALAGTARAQDGAEGVTAALEVSHEEGMVRAGLAWLAEADTFYEIYSTTNLAGPWELAVADPVNSTNLVGQMELLSAERSRFFRVRKLDTQGPAITARYPGAGAVGVGRFAALSLELSDSSGLNTNSCRLTVNGGTAQTNGCLGVTALPDGFQFAPFEAWGDYGATVTVSFACLDLKGNATYQEWFFVLEVQPLVSDNLLHLSTVQPAQSTSAPTLMSLPPPPGVRFVGGLTLIEQTADSITFGYSGSHGLYAGAVLVSHDASNRFYRRITSLSDDPANGRVTAYTQDVPLTDIVQEGSFSPEVFIPVGGLPQTLWGDADLGVGIPFNLNQDFAVGTLEWPNVRLRPAKLKVNLEGSLDLSCQIRDWQVMALGADFQSSLDMEIRSGVEFYQQFAFLSRTTTLGSAPLGYVAGAIGPVPVWIELQAAVDLTFEAKTEGSVSFYTGYDVYATANAALDWTAAGGLTHTYGGSFDVVPVPLDVPVKLTAEANLYLKPRLSALVYSLAGASLDCRRGPCVKAEYTLGDEQCEITLSDKWSVNGALTIVGVDDGVLPDVTFFQEENIVETWYWPEIPESSPVFTRHPAGGEYAAGAAVTLTASASGSPAPTYQWYQNGKALPGRTAAALSLTMGASAVGSYHCAARNRIGSSTSQTAALALPASAPAGMALIPAGSFQMGDNLDGETSAQPVHTVYVSAFYMDKTEVTWAKWQEVRTWAAASGYDIGSTGAGKAANHPVHTVSWYDCVKWLNARSQKEGLAPCYRRGGAVYKAGQYDDIACDWG
ncbi:MAG: SUMF1/EgtB/PvdO family nonheme iron enzyme, partial [Kiritimatiellae bacterium]|nr:SUMF1/EgtB/PvdO family nonheme iron enzyme [Kiritimatiellia bacterium]